MKNISKAIVNVMKAVRGMEKNSTVGNGKNAYNGTKDQDVKEVFNEQLAKNGLCIMPIEIEEDIKIERWIEDSWDYNAKKLSPKTKQSVFTKVKVKYLLLHESGESVELCGYGHGVDTQDKGAGKATTYALKNCLLYTFLTPVGKIDDSDNHHSEEIEVPNKLPLYPKSNYSKAAKSIKDGKCTFKDIEKAYIVTAEARNSINALIKNI